MRKYRTYADGLDATRRLEQKVVKYDELVAIFGYSRPADLLNCLRRNGVRVLEGLDGRFAVLWSDLEATGFWQDPQASPTNPRKKL